MRIPSKNGDFEQVVVERGDVGGLVPFLAQKLCLGVSSTIWNFKLKSTIYSIKFRYLKY